MSNPRVVAILPAAELAKRCAVHASSLVRLAQNLGFAGFRELQILLQSDIAETITDRAEAGPFHRSGERLCLTLLAESGRSFNRAVSDAAEHCCAQQPETELRCETHVSHSITSEELAARIRHLGAQSDGLILVVREHPAINRAVQDVVESGVAVVCLTSDLPASRRSAFVGVDQYAAGSTAGWLVGKLVPREQAGRVLFVCSVPFRCQLDREQGFRQVLRAEYPLLSIEERVTSYESVDVTYEAIRRHIEKMGAPSAIYNVSGANLGIGRALEDEGLVGKTVFVGHELNANSRMLLEKGVMDFAIGHDFDTEIALAIESIRTARADRLTVSHFTASRLYSRYNCAIA